jgi:hypothetical protein
MSVTRQVTIWCDDCGNWDQASATAARLRRELRDRGWTVVRDDQGVHDYCQECSQKRVAAQKTGDGQ